MPLYDRSCNACEELFEVNCKISEKDHPKECPFCGSTEGEYRPSAPAMTIRGDRLMTHKTDKGFDEVLSKIKERNPRTPLATGRNAKTQLSDNLG
jgi:putative FmdB family regulatory protein